MRAFYAAFIALILMSANAAAQQCNFRCTCANPAEHMTSCPPVNAQICEQAAQRASVGGVKCTGTMEATCQARVQIAPPPGNYAQSCDSCQHHCTFLLCSCKGADGSAQQSGINYVACPGHTVANVGGKLVCGQ